MLTLFTACSPTVFKVLIALEELGLDFECHPVNVALGEQLRPEVLKVTPNGRIPALVDPEPADGGEPITVFESGAILIYLGEKTGKLMPSDTRRRTEVTQWIMWQMAGLGPTMGHARHFRHYAQEKIPYAIDRFTHEATRLYSVLDQRLQGREWICGELSMADICCWPWLLYSKSNGQRMEDFPDLARWFEAFGERPAVRRVAAAWWEGVPIEDAVPVPDAVRQILFSRTSNRLPA